MNSPIISAGDVHNVGLTGFSIIDEPFNFMTQAVPAAALSGLYSVLNTPIEIANLAGADIKELNTEETLRSFDDDLANYYVDHKSAVDTMGFLLGAVGTGTAALKAIKLAKAGKAGANLARVFNFAVDHKEAALKKIAADVTVDNVYGAITANKLKAMAWATADNALMSAAVETFVAGTMAASPIFDGASLSDITKQIAMGAAFGTVIGGSIESLMLNKKVKDLVGVHLKQQRIREALTHLGNTNLPEGDKIFSLLDSLVDRMGDKEIGLLKAGRYSEIATKTEQDARIMAQEIALGKDTVLSNAFMDQLFGTRNRMLSAGATPEQVKDELLNQLVGATMIRRLPEYYAKHEIDPSEYVFLMTKAPTKKPESFDHWMSLITAKQAGEETTQIPLYIKRRDQVKIAIVVGPTFETSATNPNILYAQSAEHAQKMGADLILLQNGRLKHNPVSENIIKVRMPSQRGEVIWDLRDGKVVTSAEQTLGDIAVSAKSFKVSRDGTLLYGDVYLDGRVGNSIAWKKDFSPNSIPDWIEESPVNVSARYVWAGMLSPDNLSVLKSVHEHDFALWDRLLHSGFTPPDDFAVRLANGKIVPADQYIAGRSLDTVVKQAKFKYAMDAIEKQHEKVMKAREAGRKDVFELDLNRVAQRLNMDRRLLEGDQTTPVAYPLLQQLQPRYGVVRYNFDPPTDPDGMIMRGVAALEQRKIIAKQQADDAFRAVFGKEVFDKFMELDARQVQRDASLESAASNFFKRADADYKDPVGTMFLHNGKQTAMLKDAIMKISDDTLQAPLLAIKEKPEAAAEWSMLINMDRRSPQRYVPVDLSTPTEVRRGLVLRSIVASKEWRENSYKVWKEAIESRSGGLPNAVRVNHEETWNLLQAHTKRNRDRVNQLNVLHRAMGFHSTMDPDTFYAPPINTGQYKFFAFVHTVDGAMVRGSTNQGVIVAKSADELQALLEKVPDHYEISVSPEVGKQISTPTLVTRLKTDIERYHKAKGDYDYALGLNENFVQDELARKGLLSEYWPKTEPTALIDDLVNWHRRQDVRLVTTGMETRFAQQFAELRALGDQFDEVASSRFAGLGQLWKKKLTNPYTDYIRTALDRSNREQYTLWQEANEFTEALGRTAFTKTAEVFGKAKAGSISWKDANAVANKYGLGNPYGDGILQLINTTGDRNYLSEVVSKVNMVLSTATLRLDFFNSINTLISLPIMYGSELAHIRQLVKNSPELLGKLGELRNVKIPGQDQAVPSMLKLISGSISDFFGPRGKELVAEYANLGLIRTELQKYGDVLDNIRFKEGEAIKVFGDRVSAGVEIASKITLNKFSEEFTAFIAANTMQRLTDPLVLAGKMTQAEQKGMMSVFVSRVHGTYLASQRPVVFQGVLGQSIGLFQTYIFNLLQNLFRYVSAGERKTVAIMMGLQGSIYGLNGIPFFDFTNRTLLGNSPLNPEHKDAYSQLQGVLGKEMSEWALYGTPSAMPFLPNSAPAIYSRGDINPRHLTIVPLPWNYEDVPFVSGTIRAVANIIDMGKKLAGGADISNTVLEALEHNGLNRPLAGFAATINGYSTTSKGSLIAASNDYGALASAARILGAKPAAEAIALDANYRTIAYKLKDRERMIALGEIVKTKLRDGEAPSEEELLDFMQKYAKAGGDIKYFQQAMVEWSKDARESVINQVAEVQGRPYAQYLQSVMGGTPLPDLME